NRNYAYAAQRDHRQRHCVIAGEDQETFRHMIENLCNLPDVAAGFFYGDDVGDLRQAPERRWLNVCAGAAYNAVEHQRLVYGFCDGLEMLILDFLRGLVVIR